MRVCEAEVGKFRYKSLGVNSWLDCEKIGQRGRNFLAVLDAFGQHQQGE